MTAYAVLYTLMWGSPFWNMERAFLAKTRREAILAGRNPINENPNRGNVVEKEVDTFEDIPMPIPPRPPPTPPPPYVPAMIGDTMNPTSDKVAENYNSKVSDDRFPEKPEISSDIDNSMTRM